MIQDLAPQGKRGREGAKSSKRNEVYIEKRMKEKSDEHMYNIRYP